MSKQEISFSPTQLSTLPRQSGVYYFYDRSNNLLYVGKATSLRTRVSSYWSRPLDPRLSRMVPQITQIRVQETETALEALILEANEIHHLQPPYNVRGKDSKTFAQIALTKEDFPRFLILRPTQRPTVPIDRTFGPYVSGLSARLALKTLRSIFRYECKGKPMSGRPCLNYHLKLCPGVCMGTISSGEYKKLTNRVVLFLEGKKQRIIRHVERGMQDASKKQQYEEAARLRDELFALTHIRDTAFMTDDAADFLSGSFPKRLEAYDISNLGAHAAVGSMVVLEHGQPNTSDYRRFKIRRVEGQNDIAMLREVLERRFNHDGWPLPDFILVDGGLAQRRIAERVLKEHSLSIPVAGVVKGPQRKLARLVLSDSARQWLRNERLTTQLFEPVVRLARDEAHRFAIRYHRELRSKQFTNQ